MPNFSRLDRTGNKVVDTVNDVAYHVVSIPGKIVEAVANELFGSSPSSGTGGQTTQQSNTSDNQKS